MIIESIKFRGTPSMKTYTTTQVAKIMGVHLKTVQKWITDGKLPATQLAPRHKWIIRETDIPTFKRIKN